MDEEVAGAMLASFYSERSVASAASRGSGGSERDRSTIKRARRKDKHVSWGGGGGGTIRARSMERHPGSPQEEESDSHTPIAMSQSQIIGPSSSASSPHPIDERERERGRIQGRLSLSRSRRPGVSRGRSGTGTGSVSASASIVFMGVWALVGFRSWRDGFPPSFSSGGASSNSRLDAMKLKSGPYIPASYTHRGMVLSQRPAFPHQGGESISPISSSGFGLNLNLNLSLDFHFTSQPPLPRPLLFVSPPHHPSKSTLDDIGVTFVDLPSSTSMLTTAPRPSTSDPSPPSPGGEKDKKAPHDRRDGPLTPQPPETPKVDKERIIGRISAWICTTFYLTCRLPQIWKNFIRKSCQGLSPFLFLFAFLGNLFYVTSIISSPEAKGPGATAFLLESLPYLIGSGGVLSFDIIILTQAYLYRGRKPRKGHIHSSTISQAAASGGIHSVRSCGSLIAAGPGSVAGGRGRRTSQSRSMSFSTATGLSRSRTREGEGLGVQG